MEVERRAVDSESIRRLAILETKLDQLLKNSNDDHSVRKELAKRVDDLENHRHWMTGGVAGLMLVSSLLVFGLRGHVRDIAVEEVVKAKRDGDTIIAALCDTDRVKNSPYSERPKICQL